MTNKEKAEAYVREKLPELMELTFGCVVKYPSDTRYASADELDNPQFTEAKVLLHAIIRGFDDWDEYFYTFNDWNEYEDISGKLDDGELEIIGHPIQPHHWLQCLVEATKNSNLMLNYRNEIVDMTNFGNKHFKNNYLIIGTERFYQEFNQIVGVC